MNVLLVGGGGREHALAWKIRQSPLVGKLYCAPGNPGIAEVAECLPVGAEEIEALTALAAEREIGLVVVGPEAPLAAGLADQLRAHGRLVVGPGAEAAHLETSKAFAKELMQAGGIPTAAHEVFGDLGAAKAYLTQRGAPIVVKADGLAAGKGVIVCQSIEEAHRALEQVLEDRAFGSAGDRVLLEDFLVGTEASFLVLSDGSHFIPLATAKDHKAAFDGDRGPNTGGMGVISPAPVLGEPEVDAAKARVVEPALRAMRERGSPFQGFLYAGLMVSGGEPKVLEFNVRMGDPEAQAILPRLRSDLVPALLGVARGDLTGVALEWDPRPCVTVILASEGYPGPYPTGRAIHGLSEAAALPDVLVFHAGTRSSAEGTVTAGGRVLAVSALGDSVAEASRRAYAAVDRIHFEGMHYRTDIGVG